MSKELGETVTIRATIKDPEDSNKLVDPESVLLTIVNPDDTTVLSCRQMTKESVGVYVYKHTISVAAQIGGYTGNIKATNTDDFIDIKKFSFVTEAAT